VYQKLGNAFKQLPPEQQNDILKRSDDPIIQENIAEAYKTGQNDFNDMMKLPNRVRDRFK
jgi:hypothetical protein